MAKNDKHGKPSDDLDMDFDDFDFDELDKLGDDEGDPRSPKSRLKKFGSTLKEEALSPQARRQYLHDALPQNYHTTLNAAESISDAASDLYNDSIMKEWEKSRGIVKKVIRADAAKLRRFRLNKLVDWAEQRDDEYRSDYNAEESEVQRQLGQFGGDVSSAMRGGNLSPQERREFLTSQRMEDDVETGKEQVEQTYQDTTIRQQTTTVALLSRILENGQRKIDYQDQIDFNYKKKQLEIGIRGLITQRKNIEQVALMRAELKEGLGAIAKNTGLPDYVKITAQENAKRLLRDKMVTAASDWVGSRLSGTMRSFMNQTKHNLATMGMSFREKAEMYSDGKEMMDGVGMSLDDVIMSMGANLLRSQVSKRGAKQIRKWLGKNPKYTSGLDYTEALLANAGTYANMAMEGRSGLGKLDRLLERGGYSGLAQQQRYRLMDSNVNRQDEAAYMDRRLKTTFLDVYPAWFSKIWKSIEGLRTNQDPSKIENFHYDFKYNRLRGQGDLQKEFDNETMDESRIKNYNDGIDNWINKLDPKGTLSDDARATVRRWLINNHSAGRESFPVSLYRGEGLPKGTSSVVRNELEEKIPYLAGFDPIKVNMIMDEGVGLELKVLRENPEYRRVSKSLGNADSQARNRHPVDNQKLARMTERYGANFAVDSGLARYDREGNVRVDNENIVKMVNGGGNRNYHQRANMDWIGGITPIEGVDQRQIPDDTDRTPFTKMGKAVDRKSYEVWANAALSNINGSRIKGFATGGFTKGDPDKVAGVTHGDEAVIDSTGTKNNRGLLAGIMKLGAPVSKNGKLNRVYFRALGFKSPEQVDRINDLINIDVDGIKDKTKTAFDRVKSKSKEVQETFENFRRNNMHRDGYSQAMGPTPEFIGPVRTGGLRNKLIEANDLLHDPAEMVRRANVKERVRNAGEYIKNFDHRQVKESASEYSRRAREAVRKANQSSTIDFGKTKLAIDKAIAKGEVGGSEAISLFLEGQDSPFITKGDFATGRFRNKTSGKVITRPADIMDDIVLVDDHGEFEIVATMIDMLEGVYDSRGNLIKLAGLEAGYRKYIKRTTQLGAAIRNTKIARTIVDLKQKFWDDQPVDVCILVNGELVVVLKASGFLTGQYIDAETGDVLKSHNDIKGVVKNQQGETVLSIEELTAGIYDTDGYRLKISKLKHWRNVAVNKIENFVKKQFGELRNRALSKALSFFEKDQSKDVYVMRWTGSKRELAKAFSIQDMEDGQLIAVKDSAVIKKISDIKGPIYSKISKAVVVKEDELQYGFFNKDGTPYKDWKGMSLDDRLEHQKDRLVNFTTTKAKDLASKFMKGYKGKGRDIDSEDSLDNGEEPCDVYIIVDGQMQLKLTKQGFLDHDYRDTIKNVIARPKDILSTVFSSAGRILLTTEQITNGLYTADGIEIKTERKVVGASKKHGRDKVPGFVEMFKNKLGINAERKTTDGKEPIDIYIIHGGKMKKLMNASNFTMGSYFTAQGKTINVPYDIDGAVYNSRGEIVLTEDELSKGIYNSAGVIVETSFYKSNGTPGKEGLGRKLGRMGGKIGSGISRGFGYLKEKIGGLRKGSWQEKQAKREEAERNRKSDVIVNVGDNGKEKKGFLGRLLMGLGTMFGGMFTKMIGRFGRMFKSLRNAILISKMAGAAGGVLGGAGGGRGKIGLMTKLAGSALAAGGAYAAYNAMGNAGDELMDEGSEDMSPGEQRMMEAAHAAGEPGTLSTIYNGVNDATGGLATELALTAAMGYGGKKISDMRRARALNAARPGLAARFAKGAGRTAGSAAGALGKGVSDAGRVAGAAGRIAGGAGKFVGGKAGLIARGVGALASGAGKVARWVASPSAALGRLGNVAKIGSAALKVGKFALGAARILSGPVGWGLMAATWIGGKLWDRYKVGKNPLMRFRFAQYGFDFDDEETTTKLLDLENLMKDYVTVSGEGNKPAIKDNMPEDQIFQLFEIDPNNPESQPHLQRFIAWWIKRFKPVYLSYVKQTKILLNKTDLSTIDEELGKTGKLTLIKGVHFTNEQNNPYLVSASPFKDPEEVPLNMGDVKDSFDKAMGIINRMPEEKKDLTKKADGTETKTGADKAKEEDGGTFSWLDSSKKAIGSLAEDTLKVTKILAKKTDEVFGGWFSSAHDNVKNLWDGASEWLTNATKTLSDKIKNAWEGLKSLGSSLAAGAGTAAGAVGGAVSGAGNAVYDGVVGTYEKLTGKTADTQMMVYKGFLNAGLSDNQARILTSEVGRENDYQTRYIFGGHVDANNGAQNLGMISWQKARATKLAARLKAKGLIDAKGNMVQSQAAIDEQAKYLVEEIKTDPSYKRTKDIFLSNPNVSYQAGVEVLGRNFIRWDYDGKKINPSAHHKKRDKYFGQISQQVGKDASTKQTPAQMAAETKAAVANTPVKAGQTQVTTAEMKKLQTAAPKPATPLGPAAMKKWETEEAARKKKLEATRKGILSGTHVLSDSKENTSAPLGPTGGGGIVSGNVPKDHRAVKAATIATQKAGRSSAGYCAKFVANALQGAGYKFTRQNSAFQYASGPLQSAGFTKISNSGQYQIGDVMVWPAHGAGNGGGATHGHIQIFNGRNWVSDFIQQNVRPGSSYASVTPSLWRDSTLLGKNISGSVAVKGAPASNSEAKESLTDAASPNKITPSSSNNPVQIQQAASRQRNTQDTDVSYGRLPGGDVSQSAAKQANYQNAEQQVNAGNATTDQQARDLQLQESRLQTGLLREIRDAVTGHRSDSNAIGDQTSKALGGMNKAQQAQVELVAAGMSTMIEALKDMRQTNSKGQSLKEQFPIAANK